MKSPRVSFRCALMGAGAVLSMGGCRSLAPEAANGRVTPSPLGVFVRSWLLCGPIPCPAGDTVEAGRRAGHDRDWLADVGGEKGIRPVAGATLDCAGVPLVWKRYESAADRLDFLSALSGAEPLAEAVVYAWSLIDCETDCEAWLALGSDDTVKAFVNGECVHDRFVFRGVGTDQDIVPVRLREGRNTLLLKVVNGTGGWAAVCRVLTFEQLLSRLRQDALGAELVTTPVFVGEAFPTFSPDVPPWLGGVLGTPEIRARFYDADYNEVAKAARPGRYGAVVEVVPPAGTGPPRIETATLFRQRGEVRWRHVTWETFAAELPRG
ncbi:MAG: hypothetical protein JXR77_10505, partial [Lentisphaeria bacterium]|nr:hypothetical protein [Lentisphaeria bacterium]